MTDYISREAVKELFDGIYDCADLVFEPDDQICAKQHSSCGSCRWLETKRAIQKRVMSIPAADVRPVVLCGNCSIHDKCSTEDVFKFAGLSEDNRFCAAGRTKNGTMDAETRRLKRGLLLNELGYPYDLPNREG